MKTIPRFNPMLKSLALSLVVLIPASCRASEAPQITPSQIGQMIDRLKEADVNSDGRVTRQEWLAYRARLFDRLDQNGDGVLSIDDVPPFLRDGAQGQSLRQALIDCDLNHDGQLSRAEFVFGPTPVFDLIDINKDGVIDANEIRLAKAAISRR